MIGNEHNFLLTCDEFIKKHQNITDFYAHNIIKHKLRSQDGLTLSVLEFKPIDYTKTLVIIPGRGEIEYKYAEFLYSLRDLKLRVIVPFVRGQGHSTNTLSHSNATYIEDFNLYRTDILSSLQQLSVHNFAMLSFSLGALIALDFIKYEKLLPTKLCTIAPFLYPYINLPDCIVNSFIRLANLCCKNSYAPHHGEYKRISFDKNIHTHCKERYEKYHDYYEANYQNCPGGITYAFLNACLNKQQELLYSNYELNVPLLCLIPLEDKIVAPNKTLNFVHKHKHDQKSLSYKTIEHAYHDILNEVDDIRNNNLYLALDFLFS